MPKKKPYTFYWCRDCEVDFIVTREVRRPSCPNCADSIHVEGVREIWIERPFNYKRRWTNDEDDFLTEGVSRGMTHAEIGKEVNRTGKAVTRRLSQLRRSRNEENLCQRNHQENAR